MLTVIIYISLQVTHHNKMREWLSGGAPPCQGGGRGFDPRLALAEKRISEWISFFCEQEMV